MNANVLVAKKWHISFFSERQAAREHFRLSFTQTYVLAIMMIALLGVYYVWILNQNATKGYNIRTLQTEYFGDAGSRQANISRDARCTIYDEGVEYLN